MPSRTRIIGEPPVRFPPFSRYAEFVFRKAALKIAFAGSKALHGFLEVLIFTVIEDAAFFGKFFLSTAKSGSLAASPSSESSAPITLTGSPGVTTTVSSRGLRLPSAGFGPQENFSCGS